MWLAKLGFALSRFTVVYIRWGGDMISPGVGYQGTGREQGSKTRRNEGTEKEEIVYCNTNIGRGEERREDHKDGINAIYIYRLKQKAEEGMKKKFLAFLTLHRYCQGSSLLGSGSSSGEEGPVPDSAKSTGGD